MFERLPEFLAAHPLLCALFAVAVAALIINELLIRRNGPRMVQPEAAVQLINADAVVVDLRETAEFKKGHIVNARSVPPAKLAQRAAELAAETQPLLIYCNNGVQSGRAVETLKTAGAEQLNLLAGGLVAWRGAGFPVVRKQDKQEKK